MLIWSDLNDKADHAKALSVGSNIIENKQLLVIGGY